MIVFASFVARLSSVKVIDAPETTIEDLTDLQDELDEQLGAESTIIFPLVKTVILDELGVTLISEEKMARYSTSS